MAEHVDWLFRETDKPNNELVTVDTRDLSHARAQSSGLL